MCLVTFGYCGQTAGCINMLLVTKVGLSPGDIVLDGTHLIPRKRAQQPPVFGPCLMWPNDWMDQDTTWYGGRPWHRRQCIRWDPALPTERDTVRLCGIRHISTSGLGVGASRASFVAVFAIFCTNYRVS